MLKMSKVDLTATVKVASTPVMLSLTLKSNTTSTDVLAASQRLNKNKK
jgi:hypothetical protein